MKLIYSLLFLLIVSLSSCQFAEPIENHRGGIIYEKDNPPRGMRFVVKFINKDHVADFKTIYVLKLDYDRYEVRDTIK